VKPDILTGIFNDFSQALQANARIVPFGHHRFLPNLFQFIIRRPIIRRCTVSILKTSLNSQRKKFGVSGTAPLSRRNDNITYRSTSEASLLRSLYFELFTHFSGFFVPLAFLLANT
jgi:hypothetical protein